MRHSDLASLVVAARDLCRAYNAYAGDRDLMSLNEREALFALQRELISSDMSAALRDVSERYAA